eukprot:scaffold2094_cov192-Skeletonema_marinoi.AAC.4
MGMEDILMGSDSDSDADDGKVGDADMNITAVPAPAPVATATNSSKSELTNRLKNLYSSSSPPKSTSVAPTPNPIAAAPPRNIPPTMNVARTGGPSSSHNPNYVPPMVHNQHPHNNVPAASASSQQQIQQPQHAQQQQPPPLVGVGRVPAPLPKARTNIRSAPPPNRIAAVPNHTIPPSPMTASSVPPRQSYSASAQSSSRPRQHQAPPPQPNPLLASSDHSANSTSRSAGQTSSTQTEQEKKEKEKFLMFTRVLMKYLEQRDPDMHAKAKQQIKECYERNKMGDPAYKSLTQSMKARLKVTVGDDYWRKAQSYLEHFFKQKQKERARAGEQPHGSSSQPPQPPQPPQPHPHQQQQQQQPAPPIVRTAVQHPPSQPQVQQPMIPPPPPPQQQQKIPIQQPPALTKQQVDAQKKKEREKEEAAKKRREQRNANAKAKRAAAKKAKETAAAALQGKVMPPAGTTSYSSAHIPTPALASSVAVPGSSVTSATASVSSVGSKKETKKKPKKAPSRPSVTKKKKAEASYKFKDNVDHAFLIDVKSLPNILPKDNKLDLNLDEEQRILLYGDQRRREKVRAVTDAAADALSAGVADGVLSEAGIPQLPWKLPAVYEGWGERNLVSVRTAWAKVRLPESELQQEERLQGEKSIETEADVPTSSADNVISAPSITSKPIEERAPTRLEDDTTNHVWHNDTRAEQDPTLALLSEATEMFLKEAIEKAVGKARLRQNLDGVRLWHTLHSHHADSSSTNGKQPPALIRLGCDVRRQVALADGNAVKTYQRMEEAIGRDNDTFHFEAEDPEKMVLEATSMADLSRKPPLKSAASDADSEAKRRFEVFAGKDNQEPPFGKVPKKAKVILKDLSVGAVGNQTPAIRARRRRLLGGW